MVTNNAWNSQNPAQVAMGGTGVASNTAYTVLCGGTTTTNPIQSIASVGTTGQVLTSNGAGALPTFQAAGGGSGFVVGQGRTISTTATSTTTGLDYTGKTPTTANTVLLLSVTYTPTSATNVLYFDFSVPYSTGGTSNGLGLFLFQGSTFLAGFPYKSTTAVGNEAFTATGRYYKVSGTTSSTTYAIYYVSSVNGVTVYACSDQGTNFYNSATAVAMNFTVTEVLP